MRLRSSSGLDDGSRLSDRLAARITRRRRPQGPRNEAETRAQESSELVGAQRGNVSSDETTQGILSKGKLGFGFRLEKIMS